MKIAVTAWKFSHEGLAQDLTEQGEIAESLGFDSFWLPENHFTGSSAIPAPLMLLAAIAAKTNKIKLGTTSYLLPIRNPILAAEEVSVLDRLSGGRLILGIGRGFQASMFKPFGIHTSEKRRRFKSNLDLMISAWKGEPIDQFEGKEITLSPLPIQKPHPPLWVAAFGPLAIKQAGSLGLPYIASPVETLSSLKENILAHQGHVRDTGHSPVAITPVMRTIFVTSNPWLEKQVRASLRAEVASRFRDTESGVDEWAVIGDGVKIKDKLAEYEETLGMNYLIARGRIQGVDNVDQVRSHELLLSSAG